MHSSGWLGLAPAASLAGRLVYEQTFLTWSHGPHMVGFALAHALMPWLLVGMVGAFWSHLWVVLFAFTVAYRLARNRVLPQLDWIQCSVIVLVLTTFYVPYGWWQYATVTVAGPGHKSVSQLCAATAQDQRYLVKALLNAGVSVNTPDYDGRTALDAACTGAGLKMAHYLLARGADLDQAPACRKIPEFAARMKPEPPPPPPSNRPHLPGITVEVN